jgi:pimeloyl-ACP methyl ester carboxylesterase
MPGTGLGASLEGRCLRQREGGKGGWKVKSARHGQTVHYRSAGVGGIGVFYREAGPADAPVVLLLHGFPASSRMFRDLIPRLPDAYHVIAPDYPGFGHSAVPDRASFGYTFDHLADVVDGLLDQLGISKFAMYVMDFGGPVGYRLALRHPERLSAIIMQNAPLYPEEPKGWWETIGKYWADGSAASREASRRYLNLEDLRKQYVFGVQDPTAIDPDSWVIDKALIDRPGVDEIMLDLLYDIHNNVPTFTAMREFIRERRPPTLVATGANDEIFPEAVVHQILDDHPGAEYHALPTGHFALEDRGLEIAMLMRGFLARVLPSAG